MKIIGIIGCRRRDTRQDFEAIEREFRKAYEPGDRIVSGGCHRGGDRFAEIIALQLAKPGHWTLDQLFHLSAFRRQWFIKEAGAPIILHLPNWEEDGRRAGFVRNTLIARDADVLIACVAPDRKGGTEDTINKFLDKPASKAADDKERNLLLC